MARRWSPPLPVRSTTRASREVDYQGKEVDLSIYLNDIPSYQPGIYTVEAYTTQAFLGKTELLLR